MNAPRRTDGAFGWRRNEAPSPPERGDRPSPVLRVALPAAMIAFMIVLAIGVVRAAGEGLVVFGRDLYSARLRDDLVALQARLEDVVETEARRTAMQEVATKVPFEDIAILDRDLRVVLANENRHDGAPATDFPGFHAATAARALAAGTLAVHLDQDRHRLSAYVAQPPSHDGPPGGDRGALLFGSMDLTFDAARFFAVHRDVSLRTTAAALAIALVLTALLHEFVVRRLDTVVESMAAFAGGDLAARSPLKTHDEIGTVGAAFNAMADRLEHEYQLILESRERYEQVVEGSTDLIYVVDATARILFVNRASREILGLEPSECVGGSAYDIVHPDDTRLVEEWAIRLIAGTADRSSLRCRARHRDGSVRVLMMNGRRVTEADGSMRQLEVVARDITSEVEAQAATEMERRRFEALFQGARDAIVLCDADSGAIVGVNRAAEELADLPAARILGRHYTDFVPDDAVSQLRLGAPMVRTASRRADGSTVAVEMSASAVELPDGRRVDQVYLRDARERQQYEERLLHAEKMSVVGQLAGGIAHDFNNQLAGILGYAELLAIRLPEGPLRGYAERIQTAAQRSADLTRQLLAFSRKGRDLQQPVDLHALVREVAQILERSVDPRIHVRVELDAAGATVLGDATQLQNVLLNLAVNARDAMPAGGDLVLATRAASGPDAESESGDDGEWIELTVRDTGIGMDSATMARAFEPFFTTKPVGAGTGMGLAAVYGTITGHGGTIHLASEPGAGTTCIIRLPLLTSPTPGDDASDGAEAAASRDDATSGDSDTLPAPPPPHAARVLVVDDEKTVRDLMVELLRGEGFHAEARDGGRAAVAAVHEAPEPWDLVLLDLMMPDMNGEETMAALHALRPSQRVLPMSGYAPEGTFARLQKDGARGLLRKPCSRQQLLDAVRSALSDEA